MKKNKTYSPKNSRELAHLLGLPESAAAEWEFRSKLNDKIIELAKKSKVTHEELSKRVGTSRTRITALLNRSRSDFSTNFMVKVLSGLGYQVEIKVRKKAS